jgi:hypothetical protein
VKSVYSRALKALFATASVCLALAGVCGQLGHFTWGHTFLYVGSALLVATFIVWLKAKYQAAPPAQSAKNEFSDLRVVLDKGRELVVEVWYLYSGALGEDAVYIDLQPIANGLQLVGENDRPWQLGPQMTVVGHRVLAKPIPYSYAPPSRSIWPEAEKSTHLQLSMVHRTKGVFHRQTFPYEKVWP